MKTARLAKIWGVAAAAALALCLAACGQTESAPSNEPGGSSSEETSSQAESSESSAPAGESSGQEAAAGSTGNGSASASTVSFGAYPQGDGAPIQWIVLDAGPDKALLLAQDCVDSLPWDDAHSGATWDGCSLRAWLNGDFLNEAFTDDEQQAILPTDLPNGDDLGYGTPAGENTQDKVFLLSGNEVDRYFPDSSQRTAKPTPYAESHGAYTNASGDCAWWLRSPGLTETGPAYISSGGEVGTRVHEESETIIGVRPAIWVSTDYLRSAAGA